jgi:hypothetical protein
MLAQHATATVIGKKITATASAQDAEIATTISTNSTAIAQATVAAIRANPYPSYMPGKATISLYDPLSTPNYWQEASDPNLGGTCAFHNNSYHISETTPQTNFYCYPPESFGDFAFEVHMTIEQGDCGGMLFRRGIDGTGYVFYTCQDGQYALYKYTDNSTSSPLVTFSSDNTINSGLGQDNLLGVVAQGNAIILFINQQQVAHLQDNSYSQGNIALLASTDTNSTVVAYSNARIWTF